MTDIARIDFDSDGVGCIGYFHRPDTARFPGPAWFYREEIRVRVLCDQIAFLERHFKDMP